jgi:ribonuclease D
MSRKKQTTAQRNLTNPTLVYTKSSFARMMDYLQERSLLAIDTESDSLYSYYPKVCLIQITTFADVEHPSPDDVTDFLLDPLRLDSFEELGKLLADPAVEVVLHAAENDMLILQRDFNFTFHNLFDTQLAARILGWRRAGLASILQDNFGLVIDKRMQRTNWGKRPLTPQQIAYAQMDTHYLPALRARQIAELKEVGRWEEAKEAFGHLERVDYHVRPQNGRSFWQMKSARNVDRSQTNVLKAVWEWREEEAQHQDRPPFKVVSDRVLERLAIQQPTSTANLGDIAGLSDYQVRRYGKAIVAAVKEGRKGPLPDLPEPTPRLSNGVDKATQERYESLRRWRSQTAQDRGVDTDIVFSNSTLLAIAQRRPRTASELEEIAEIGPWKAKTYAPSVLPLVNGRH